MSEKTVSLEQKINIAAYYISQRNFPYDKLCWMLSERQLFVENNKKYAPEDFVRKRATDVYFSSTPYDILCWLIAEIDILLGKDAIEKRTKLILKR